MHRKERIGLTTLKMSGNWIGGIYYLRNIAYQLSTNRDLMKHYDVYLFVYADQIEAFSDLPEEIKIVVVNSKSKFVRLLSYLKNRVSILYPMITDLKLLSIRTIAWIPDFQHKYYPELFSENEINERDDLYTGVSLRSKPLILSSCSALQDYKMFYCPNSSNAKVVRFVSYIEPYIRTITSDREQMILNEYELTGKKYICIMNQFWQHKNHIVVLKAMRVLFAKAERENILFVFTGKMQDYRSPKYISELKSLFEDDEIKKHCVLLGFINREEQIALMKNAEFIIQPSLFEGWGTVVEDAKVLDKTILLSDIPVHREQMNGKCILFNPYNPEELGKLIEDECKKEHHDDIERGIMDMHERAKEYSKEFEKLLINI